MSDVTNSECFLPAHVSKSQERIAAFFDYANLKSTLEERGFKFDLLSFLRKVDEIGHPVFANVYLPCHCLNVKRVQFLENTGFRVRIVACKDVDAIMGFDIASCVHKLGINTLIIGTHDGDFSPIVDEAITQGCRVIFMCYPKLLSSLLREKVEIIDITEGY